MVGKRSVVALGVIVSCCAAAGTPALAGGTKTDAHNHRAALRDAAQLLGRVQPPAGATRSSTEPSGDGGVLGGPPFTEGVGKLVDKHAWWTVNESPDQVLDYIESHAPGGGTENTTCSGGGNQPAWSCVAYGFPAKASVLGIRELAIKVVGLEDGATGIRADAQVQWMIVRPASERVPSGVGEIAVTRKGPHGGEAATAGEPSTIRKIIRLLDALPVLQPGGWHCPAIPSGADTDTFSFEPSGGGAALARATVRADVGRSQTGCDAMSFSIGGRPQMALVDARRFLLRVGHLLHLRLTQSPN